MIAWLQGQLINKASDQIVLNVGGVGYRVFIALSTYTALPPLAEQVTLHIVTHVRDDAIQLYGFFHTDERELFNLFNSVTGIGAKLALAALSTYSTEVLVTAIAQEDLTTLARISGIGRKIGQRLILELKDRVGSLSLSLSATAAVTLPNKEVPARSSQEQMRDEVISALVNFGYRRQEVEPVVRQLLAAGEEQELTNVIRAALKKLAPA